MQEIVYDNPGWRLISFGKGMSYEFTNTLIQRSVTLHGKNAAWFRRELDSLLTSSPCDMALRRLWYLYGYGEASEPLIKP